MDYKVIVSTQAKEDLVDTMDYVMGDSERYALELHDTLLNAGRSLTAMPLRGTRRDDLVKDCRVLIVGSYLLVYKVVDKTVSIIRILHQSQNAHNMFE